jgi:hypothetical protein
MAASSDCPLNTAVNNPSFMRKTLRNHGKQTVSLSDPNQLTRGCVQAQLNKWRAGIYSAKVWHCLKKAGLVSVRRKFEVN